MKNRGDVFLLFVIIALFIDLVTPFLIWKEIVPPVVRWISHASIVVMIFVVYSRILVFDRVPGIVFVIAAISLIGGMVAFTNGQGPAATIWGWWTMFQFPFVGLFAYLQPEWPHNFPKKLLSVLSAIMLIEVLIQLAQYLSGESLGDNLAGFFGEHGTANLVIFILLLLSFALGMWFAKGKWWMLLLVLGLGSISSLLGEMKLFPFATLGLVLVSAILILLRGKGLGRLISYSFVTLAILGIFAASYNALIPAAKRRPLESFLELETLDQYFGFANTSAIAGEVRYRSVGRNTALSLAWERVTQDRKTLLLGMGLGASGESRTLGSIGIGLTGRNSSLTSATSLEVILQELSPVGIVALLGFFLWVVIRMYMGIREQPNSDLSILRYGILFFSLFWPVWLWYSTVWVFRVPMLIYWVVLGYVLSHSDGRGVPILTLSQKRRIERISLRRSSTTRAGQYPAQRSLP